MDINTTETAELNMKKGLKVYPSPTRSMVYINWTASTLDLSKIVVKDISGKVVLKPTFDAKSGELAI